MHRLAEEGAIDADTWSGFHGLLQKTTRYPGVRQCFALRRSWFSERFQAYVDELKGESLVRRSRPSWSFCLKNSWAESRNERVTWWRNIPIAVIGLDAPKTGP